MIIISHYQRDELLHNLYANRELMEFVNGVEWFNSKLNEIWESYYEHVKMPNKFRKNQHKLDWEIKHGYIEV